MTIWDVLQEYITNSNIPMHVKEKTIVMGKVLFRETYELNDRLKLMVIITAANHNHFYECSNAYLEYAEIIGIDNSFLKALIDSLKDYDEFNKRETCLIKVVSEISCNPVLSDETTAYAKTHFTLEEIEYIVFLTSFICFISRIDNIRKITG